MKIRRKHIHHSLSLKALLQALLQDINNSLRLKSLPATLAPTRESVAMAFSTIREHKLRSFLTVLGVVIGVMTVMAIASIISGIDYAVTQQVESVGTNSISIYKFDRGLRLTKATREERMRKPLTYDDAIALRELSSIEVTSPFLNVTTDAYGNKVEIRRGGMSSTSITLQGVLPDYEKSGAWLISQGRFFTDVESSSRQNVCVIGASVADQFFSGMNPLDKYLTIGNKDFRIIGVLEHREQLMGGESDQNNVIFIPFDVARQIKPFSDDVYILAVAKSGMMIRALEEVADLLRRRRNVPFDAPNNFGISTSDSMIQSFHSITVGVAAAMIVISSVGLIVGGIGVMNIMLVGVTERTAEIGIRKAVGGRRIDIMRQFLVEAMTLTGVGGLIGLFLGWLSSLLIKFILPSYVPLWAPVVGFISSVGIGLIFGLWPAWKASRLDPIAALRYE